MKRPSLAILISTFLWGTLWIPLRRLDHAGLSDAWATTAAFTIPLLGLLPFGILRRRRIVRGGRPLLAAGFFMAAAISLYAQGLLRGYVSRVILLFYLTPVWSTLLGWALLGYAITLGRVATIALGLAGMFVVLGSDAHLPLPRSMADWMGLTSGLCWGWAMVCVRRTEHADELDKLIVQFLFLGALFFLFSLLPGGGEWSHPDTAVLLQSSGWLLLLGLFWMPAVVWLTMYGGSRIDPGRVAILLMLEVVIGLASAAILTDEPFGVRELLGAALVLGACATEVFVGRIQPVGETERRRTSA